MNANLFINLQSYGEKYFNKYLIYKNIELERDCWEGFKFILGYTFLRGRRDEYLLNTVHLQ